jgi:hypothetical protein
VRAPDPANDNSSGMLDADGFLAFAARLRAAHGLLENARVSDEQRGRWQRRLIAITEAARRDLDRAGSQLARFESDLERQLGS